MTMLGRFAMGSKANEYITNEEMRMYYSRFTDAGAPSGLSRTSREVMTTVQGVTYF